MANPGNNASNRRIIKYVEPTVVVNYHGNDPPITRNEDILLLRAEALNELNAWSWQFS